MSVCKNSGSMAVVPYSTTPSMVISTVPTAKLRSRRTEKFTIGSSVTISRTMKDTIAITDTTASVRIRGEENQSSSWPLSSMICIAPSHNDMNPNPR